MTLPIPSTKAGLTEETLRDVAQRHEWSAEQAQARGAAFAAFAAAEMPRLERTDLSKLTLADYHVAVEAGVLPDDVRETVEGHDHDQRAGLFVQSNGEIVVATLNPALVARGVILGSLAAGDDHRLLQGGEEAGQGGAGRREQADRAE